MQQDVERVELLGGHGFVRGRVGPHGPALLVALERRQSGSRQVGGEVEILEPGSNAFADVEVMGQPCRTSGQARLKVRWVTCGVVRLETGTIARSGTPSNTRSPSPTVNGTTCSRSSSTAPALR